MHRLLLILAVFILVACESAPIKNVKDIATQSSLKSDIRGPVNIPVAYYTSAEELSRVYVIGTQSYPYPKFLGKDFGDALQLVMPSVFSKSEKLSDKSQFEYLFVFESKADYGPAWGTYSISLNTKVLDDAGRQVFNTETKGVITSGGPADPNAYKNAYATAIKEAVIQFVNTLEKAQIDAIIQKNIKRSSTVNVRDILPDLKPTRSGTGFYINQQGSLVTAAHVISECLIIDILHQGKKRPATILAKSKILDLAVLGSEVESTAYLGVSNTQPTPTLGRQIFAMGYPLSGILSEQPNLTIGNISSLGGLKGATGYFQYTAPTQPGNSGGPVVDYNGNLMGIVTSTLNQSMMLDRTGTTSQNINFGLNGDLLVRFLDKHSIHYYPPQPATGFEQASEQATAYTVQVLCYQ